MMSLKMLTKSRYLLGLQCPKLLWVATNEPGRIPAPDAATQRMFDQGNLVGSLAQQLFPGGIKVPAEGFKQNLAETQKLLSQRKPLFEAGIMAGRLYSRADVLRPAGGDAWDIVEVKSSTDVKEINIDDVAFQKLCCEDSGLKIRHCFLACINNQYVRHGAIDPEALLEIHDITDESAAASCGLQERVNAMLTVIDQPACPAAAIGRHCRDPYACALTECWDRMPEHHIFTLYRGGKKSEELYQSGVVDIAHIPTSCPLNEKQAIQRRCVINGQPHIDAAPLRQFIASLEYPLYYLDFETISAAVPLFDGTRPYQNVPFQFSLHIQAELGRPASHHSYLADGPQDPRPELLAQLSEAIGSNGSVVAYNKSFEQSVLRELGVAFPEYADWVEGVIGRLVDLIVPFRGFHYYHPAQKGSASIKHVLPSITGKGYEGLEIAKGDMASLAFLALYHGEGPAGEEECRKVRRDLLEYCGLDTEAMVDIIAQLAEII